MIAWVPFLSMLAVIVATVLRGIVLRLRLGERPLALLSATGAQSWAGLAFAMSVGLLLIASIGGSRAPQTAAMIAALLAIVGAAIVIVAQLQMGRAWRIGVREGDAPLFVSTGLFRFSRNPIFAGMILLGLAAALISWTWWAWAALAVFVAACIAQVRIEERHLEASFGQTYRTFKEKVPRWIGAGIRGN